MTDARVEVCPKSLARECMSPSRSKGAAYHTLSNLEDYAETDCSFHLRARNSHSPITILIMLISTLTIKAEAQYSTSHCVTLPKITTLVFFRLLYEKVALARGVDLASRSTPLTPPCTG